jgi:hypothetical protein
MRKIKLTSDEMRPVNSQRMNTLITAADVTVIAHTNSFQEIKR